MKVSTVRLGHRANDHPILAGNKVKVMSRLLKEIVTRSDISSTKLKVLSQVQ